ncbi:unnamed protein product [Rhodiola kirilowii]
MEMALGIKMKLGFICGEFTRPIDAYQGARWDKCNNVVLSWIINSVSPEIGSSLIHSTDYMHAWEDLEERLSGTNDFTIFSIQQEISMLMQKDKTIAQYHNKLIQLWVMRMLSLRRLLVNLIQGVKQEGAPMTGK